MYLNSTWLAECAEFASTVIELVIGNYYALQLHLFCLRQRYKKVAHIALLQRDMSNTFICCLGIWLYLQLEITVFENCNHYVVITFGF